MIFCEQGKNCIILILNRVIKLLYGIHFVINLESCFALWIWAETFVLFARPQSVMPTQVFYLWHALCSGNSHYAVTSEYLFCLSHYWIDGCYSRAFLHRDAERPSTESFFIFLNVAFTISNLYRHQERIAENTSSQSQFLRSPCGISVTVPCVRFTRPTFFTI